MRYGRELEKKKNRWDFGVKSQRLHACKCAINVHHYKDKCLLSKDVFNLLLIVQCAKHFLCLQKIYIDVAVTAHF